MDELEGQIRNYRGEHGGSGEVSSIDEREKLSLELVKIKRAQGSGEEVWWARMRRVWCSGEVRSGHRGEWR